MSSLFRANLKVHIKIAGCPESGVAALDYRRAHGLPERLDNRHDVEIKGEISEADFRELVAAGYGSFESNGDGAQELVFDSLDSHYSPLSLRSGCAVIEVSPSDIPIQLACRALQSCAREEQEYKRRKARDEAEKYIRAETNYTYNQILKLVDTDYLDDPLRMRFLEAVAAHKAEEEQREVEKVAYNTERAAWIVSYGSDHLKRLIAEGIRCNVTYFAERMARERPGWEDYDKICGIEVDIRDADPAWLDALDEARKTVPDAKLGWLAGGSGAHLNGCAHESDDPGVPFTPGPALFADFLGNRIVKKI